MKQVVAVVELSDRRGEIWKVGSAGDFGELLMWTGGDVNNAIPAGRFDNTQVRLPGSPGEHVNLDASRHHHRRQLVDIDVHASGITRPR